MMQLKQLNNANKVYLLAIIICIILVVEFVGSNYFKALWFSVVNDSTAKLDNLDIRIREGWYPTLNTDKDFKFKIFTVVNTEHSQTKAIIFRKPKDDHKHLIVIALLSEKMAIKINDKVSNDNKINSNIGPLYFMFETFDEDGDKNISYFSSKYNITVTTIDTMDLMDIIKVKFTDAKRS